jgi:5-formyltetrahydrofolate cyclo-ligase
VLHPDDSRDELRRTLRARRRALTGNERTLAQARLTRAIRSLNVYRVAKHVAVYFAVDGEVDLAELIAATIRRGVSIYAPQLADDRLMFRALGASTALTTNRYGIPEPSDGAPIDARSLDLVLTPLVGFDRSGARLGMGKGYYDRTFEFLKSRRTWLRPKLLGVGFAFQEIPKLDIARWDIGLWGIVTDVDTIRSKTGITR